MVCFNAENWEELPPSSYWNSGLVIINEELTAVRGFNGYRYNIYITTGPIVEHYPSMNTAHSMTAVVSTSGGNCTVVIGGGV